MCYMQLYDSLYWFICEYFSYNINKLLKLFTDYTAIMLQVTTLIFKNQHHIAILKIVTDQEISRKMNKIIFNVDLFIGH